MTKPTRLYGRDGDEDLWGDLDEAADVLDYGEQRYILQEFSVHPTRYHMPTVDHIIEWIDEWTAENGMVGEGFDLGGAADEEVRAAFEAALDLWASKVSYVMADKIVGRWVVHYDPVGLRQITEIPDE